MDEAFLALLEKKDFAYITVKEICAAAGVNRSTFYLHYETVGDLLHESVAYMLRQFLDYMAHDTETFVAKLHTCPLQELYLLTPEYLTPYLNYIREHRRLFRTATENAAVLGLDRAYDQMYRHVLTPILERYGVPQEERAYRMAFSVQGLMANITEWLRRNCADSVERIFSILPQKEFICCTSSCLTRTRSSPVRSSWTKSGGCLMNARSKPTSTGCATVFPTARILRSSPCADLGIRR